MSATRTFKTPAHPSARRGSTDEQNRDSTPGTPGLVRPVWPTTLSASANTPPVPPTPSASSAAGPSNPPSAPRPVKRPRLCQDGSATVYNRHTMTASSPYASYGMKTPKRPRSTRDFLQEAESDDESDDDSYKSLIESEMFMTPKSSKKRRIFECPASPSPMRLSTPRSKRTPGSMTPSFGLTPMAHMFARTGLSPFGSTLLHAPSRTPFKIPTAPYKVLDAPELQDDYYLNLLDWSSTDQLAVGLSSCAYLWSAHSGRVTKLCDLGEEDTISSVSWAQKGQVLALGTNTGTIQLWDVRQEKLLRTLADHTKRIGSLVFNNDLLTSGSRDKSILQRDLRAPDVTPIILGGCSAGHTAEICGLKWNWDYTLMASGGNDNQLMLWDPRKGVLPIWKPQNPHGAAVKALSFHPRKRWVLASGGGTADRKIKTWNLQTQSLITEHDTDSQVCNLAWEDNNGHLISTHGYSRNHISVWKPIESGANNQVGFKEYASLTAHTSRVVYLALSPNHETIVTGAGDETLRFWKISEAKERKGPKRDTGTCII